MPIPEARSDKHSLRYGDIEQPGIALAQVVSDLSRGRVLPSHLVHLDPDLNPASRDRPPGWRPSFGQSGAAERHLQNQGVGPGDLFLFFGWFRQVEQLPGQARCQYRYVPTAPHLHVLFGWLQIAARIDLHQPSQIPPWLGPHPHAQGQPYAAADAIYIAREQLQLPGLPQLGALPGGGLFPQFHPALQLTAPGQRRSLWQLPGWFWLGEEAIPRLSYHRRRDRWRREGDRRLLQTVGRGQEFVLPLAEPRRAEAWLAALWEPMGANSAETLSESAILAKNI